MGLLDSLKKGINTFVDDLNKPESFKIGEKFEQYVRDNLFVDKYYKILERSHSYDTNKGDYVYSSLKPDFKFYDKANKREFFVEVKFRTSLMNGQYKWTYDDQLDRYFYYHENEAPVFALLGIGNNPSKPHAVSLIPLQYAKYISLYTSVLERFVIDPDGIVHPNDLWRK